jgi:hypothetical protein
MAGGELRLGTASIYMTTYITLAGTYQHKNIDLHGYILSGKRELIAQNQALERADKGKFRLVFWCGIYRLHTAFLGATSGPMAQWRDPG